MTVITGEAIRRLYEASNQQPPMPARLEIGSAARHLLVEVCGPVGAPEWMPRALYGVIGIPIMVVDRLGPFGYELFDAEGAVIKAGVVMGA